MQVERFVELPVDTDEVWSALTDDELLGEWLGDGVSIDPVPGGEVSVVEAGDVRRGIIDEVDRGRRLSFTWWPEDDSGAASRVSFELVPIPSGTRLSVVERPPVSGVASASAVGASVGASVVSDVRLLLLAVVSCLVRSRVG